MAAILGAVRSLTYDSVTRLVRLLLRFFFRTIEVAGSEHVPHGAGGIIVSWHPNGMIDPGLILGFCPRQVVFGARHGLFRWPVLGALMRAVGTVPIYRAMDATRGDPSARRAANDKSLAALADAVSAGHFACLFPEGDSHDAPHLLELKTGVARFYYLARQRASAAAGVATGKAPTPVIVPVGLHYDHKRLFRSRVLVQFHPPMVLPPDLDVSPSTHGDDDERQRCRRLTQEIERTLREAVHATETWELNFLMHRVRKLVRAERAHRAGADLEESSLEERSRGIARIWKAYYTRLETHPPEVAALRSRIARYDADLRALGIDDEELDRSPPLVSFWFGALLLLQFLLVYLLMPPILVVGYLLNAPPAILLWAVARVAAKKKKDEASIKILAGALIFPATWLIIGFVAGQAHATLHRHYPSLPDQSLFAGMVAALLAFVGGAVALRYLRLARETMRAVVVRVTRGRRSLAFARLRVDRAELFDALMGMSEGLELPFAVMPDGRIEAGE